MIKFRTQIPILKSNYFIDYHSNILSVGSCFAQNIGDKFEYFKFQNKVNPFGIIFNPLSIEKLILRSVSLQLFTEDDIFFYNECWHCFEVHSDLNSLNKEELLQNLNAILKSTHQNIKNCSHVIITYGTSWVYRNIESNQVVANCHKIAQKKFTKELLSINSITTSIRNTIGLIKSLNKEVEIIFTVSPVRHLKDGFVENQRSKSHLISALHNIIDNQSSNINYFPSYEIMMDELRDYRFYAPDMIHPSTIAIDYIWELFSKNYISEKANHTMLEVENIQKGLAHRPFNSLSEIHQQFLKSLQDKIALLQKQFPNLQF